MSKIEHQQNVVEFTLPATVGELGQAWNEHGADIIIGHPTYRNADTIGPLLAHGIRGAVRAFPGRKAAFVVTDGTLGLRNSDRSVMEAALAGAVDGLAQLTAEQREDVLVTLAPYEGYGGDFTPGKGSALKMVFDEMGRCDARLLLLLYGDLRNDMGAWQNVYRAVEEEHSFRFPDRAMFVTARYARHFVDASLTRFIVGPLTTLLGTFVPGGISGDIALSAGAVELERNATWSLPRRKYGTDISTTLDNLAHGTVVYEAYLGAKLHDITDEAKLSVMPGEVIGAALERLLHFEQSEGAVSRVLEPGFELAQVLRWDPVRTGIAFIDPGATDVFDIDVKMASLANRFDEFRGDMEAVLGPSRTTALKAAAALMGGRQEDGERVSGMGVDAEVWTDVLLQGVGFALRTQDLDTPKRCLNYLYTAAFLEFVVGCLRQLGYETLGQVRQAQSNLVVPSGKAEAFYDEVDRFASELATGFFEKRGLLCDALK